VATPERPNDRPDGWSDRDQDAGERELERRKRLLDAKLAARRPEPVQGQARGRTGGMAGFGQALKLSSEFVAGVAVGAGIGWAVDRFAETSPWGLIVFLLLGFGAGVLNVLRSAGLMAQAAVRAPDENDGEGSGRGRGQG
jgi:ATP synthase protein I